MLEYTESPFWAVDEEAKTKFGYNVDLDKLSLSNQCKTRIKSITDLYYLRLNPVYQGFPSLWVR